MTYDNDILSAFPLFNKYPDLVYLDSAASSQTAQPVIDAMNLYYTTMRANIHRSAYRLSGEASQAYEASRAKIASFIGADSGEIIFTSGTTAGLNMLARSLTRSLGPGDSMVLSKFEHHANLVPWQQMAKERGFEIRYVDLLQEKEKHVTTVSLDMSRLDQLIDGTTKVVSLTHTSNVTGTRPDLARIISAARAVGAVTVVDAAQAVGHAPIDVRTMDCDFLVFSGHKLCGPTGIGVLYGRASRLRELEPTIYGGGMVSRVTYDLAEWAEAPTRFEAGTPPIASAIGLGAAIQFLSDINLEMIDEKVRELHDYLFNRLRECSGIKILDGGANSGIISIDIDGVHPHDAATIFDQRGVAVRAGKHCAEPLMAELGMKSTIRFSLYLYNTRNDIDQAIAVIDTIQELFGQKT